MEKFLLEMMLVNGDADGRHLTKSTLGLWLGLDNMLYD